MEMLSKIVSSSTLEPKTPRRVKLFKSKSQKELSRLIAPRNVVVDEIVIGEGRGYRILLASIMCPVVDC